MTYEGICWLMHEKKMLEGGTTSILNPPSTTLPPPTLPLHLVQLVRKVQAAGKSGEGVEVRAVEAKERSRNAIEHGPLQRITGMKGGPMQEMQHVMGIKGGPGRCNTSWVPWWVCRGTKQRRGMGRLRRMERTATTTVSHHDAARHGCSSQTYMATQASLIIRFPGTSTFTGRLRHIVLCWLQQQCGAVEILKGY